MMRPLATAVLVSGIVFTMFGCAPTPWPTDCGFAARECNRFGQCKNVCKLRTPPMPSAQGDTDMVHQ